ncbi:MAG TPA: insulinase family protein, partial [Longimicrobium sp.]|nr:insulinase family protein [Longimicrobium sp.]
LRDVLQIKLTETLREQLGGTYSPGVGASSDRVPRPEYALQVSYGSSPENAERLTKSVFAVIDTLKTRGPSAADVAKVKEQLLRAREVQLKQNGYWLSVIAARDQAGEDIAGVLGPQQELIARLSPAQVQAAAREYLNTGRYARFVLLPAGGSGAAGAKP